MQTREQVIEGLNDIHAVACGLGDDQCYLNSIGIKQLQTLINDATELLRAQEPIAPNHVEDGNYENSGIVNHWFMCGKCGSCVDPGDKYCRECGKAVKWE